MHAEDSLRYQRQLLAYEKLNPGYTAEMVRSEAHKSARLAARQQAQEKREVLAPLAAIAKPKSAWQLFLIGCTAGTGTSFGSLNREQKVSHPLLDRCRAASAIGWAAWPNAALVKPTGCAADAPMGMSDVVLALV